MKNFALTITLLTIMVACTNDIDEIVESDKNNYVINDCQNWRCYDEALTIAEESISILDNGKSLTRGSKQRHIEKGYQAVAICRDKNSTRSARAEYNDTLMYVFNFSDNQGFAVVSASPDTEGLIAITEKGNYNPSDSTNNSGLDLFMNLAKKYVEYASRSSKGHVIIDRPKQLIDSIVNNEEYLGPYVSVKWGQNYPEGIYCPNNISGCTNTAIAQIMSYYEYPSSISLTYSGADVSSQYLNWSTIKQHIISATNQSEHSSCAATNETHNIIGRLCRQIGQLTGSDYTSNEYTGTQYSNIILALQALGYNTGNWTNYSNGLSSVCANIRNNHIYMIYGQSIYNYHLWLLDGVYTHEHGNISWTQELGSTVMELYEYNVTTDRYYHFNWGKDGIGNGYFLANVFNSKKAYMSDGIPAPLNIDYANDVNLLNVYR